MSTMSHIQHVTLHTVGRLKKKSCFALVLKVEEKIPVKEIQVVQFWTVEGFWSVLQGTYRVMTSFTECSGDLY